MEGVVGRARRLPPLRNLTDTLLLSLLSQSDSHPDRVGQGVVLFNSCDVTSCWYLILSGEVQLYLTHESGQVHPVCSLLAGSIFGEIDHEVHGCSARVTRPIEFVRIPQEHFLSLYKKYADHLSAFIVVIQDMLAETDLVGESSHLQTGYERIERIRGADIATNGTVITPATVPVDRSQEYDTQPGLDTMLNGESARTMRRAQREKRFLELAKGNGFGQTDFPSVPPGHSTPPVPPHRTHHKNDIYNLSGLRSEFDRIAEDPHRRERNDERTSSVRPNWTNESEGDMDGSVIELSNQVSLSARLYEVGWILFRSMKRQNPLLIREHQTHGRTYTNCMSGTEMVDWLLQLTISIGANLSQLSRFQIVGMWQTLMEYNLISHVTGEQQFSDQMTFFRWQIEGKESVFAFEQAEEDSIPDTPLLSHSYGGCVHMQDPSSDDLSNAVLFLSTVGPDALFRMILAKPPMDRNPEELELVYSELLHVKALGHLSTMVKRELAMVIGLEMHTHAGSALYHQGEAGRCWYIILSGSVDVSIRGKGVVCSLREGDDFGKLSLVSDTPRAATITLREDNCHFLTVDKDDFNSVLRDVEANTVRLKENGHDVLVLEKMVVPQGPVIESPLLRTPCCYSVMAGVAEKMLEYALETRIDVDDVADTFLEDFVLTHTIYMPTNILCNFLKHFYSSQSADVRVDDWSAECALRLAAKQRVVSFLAFWVDTLGLDYFLDSAGNAFIEEIYCLVLEDCRLMPGMEEIVAKMSAIRATRESAMRVLARPPSTVLECGVYSSLSPAPTPVLPSDTCNQIIYLSDSTSFAMSIRMDRNASEICRQARTRIRSGIALNADRMVAVEMKSSGERMVFSPTDISIPTMLGLNSKLYVVAKDEVSSLRASVDQAGPTESVHSSVMQYVSSSELAQQLFVMHSEMFEATDEAELITQVFGRDQFPGRTPSNLDLLLRRFNEIQFWATTEVLLSTPSRRLHTLRKFIKIAIHAKENRDLMSLFAITLGLSNVAVSRLNNLWNQLSTKIRRQFTEFEALLDPSRNHRAYRALLNSLHPPMVPFVPLILKDLTFIHEGNKTYFSGLVNEEKMHMVACVLRNFRRCKAHFPSQIYEERKIGDTQNLIRNFRVIDSQRRLMQISFQIEGRRKRVEINKFPHFSS